MLTRDSADQAIEFVGDLRQVLLGSMTERLDLFIGSETESGQPVYFLPSPRDTVVLALFQVSHNDHGVLKTLDYFLHLLVVHELGLF
jgi:hypothetical protein